MDADEAGVMSKSNTQFGPYTGPPRYLNLDVGRGSSKSVWLIGCPIGARLVFLENMRRNIARHGHPDPRD